MSRQEIIAQALQAVRQQAAVHGPGVIRLTIYESDEDLRQLRPEDGPAATAAEQRELVLAVAAALRADGHAVELRPLRAVAYLAWLSEHGLANTAAHRARWLAEQAG